jgi:DNA-binding winged helix-turn-helix (wHTH) protein
VEVWLGMKLGHGPMIVILNSIGLQSRPVASPIAFGEFVFDPESRLLVKRRTPIHLTPKAVELLALLAERRPKPVSKEEIHERVWPGVFVSEASLTALVFDLRSALGETAREPRYIRTVHGFGYAFVPDEGISIVARTNCRLICEGRVLELVNGENLVGRSIDCGVRLDSTDVSRRHARITINDDKATIEDLGSTNGTFVNGVRVTSPVSLADGMTIGFGSITAQFHAAVEEPRTEVR